MIRFINKLKNKLFSLSPKKPKVFYACPFYKNPEWAPVIMKSFRKYFPNECFVAINNNPDNSSLPEIVVRNSTVILPPAEGFKHGLALDSAVKWGKENGYSIMIVLEQDCRIEGNAWAKRMIQLIDSGYDMVGSFMHWNYIHPAISAWRINAIESFDMVKKTPEELSDPACIKPKWDDSTMKEWTEGMSCERPYWFGWISKTWDVGGRNWFLCNRRGKAIQIDCPDAKHFWMGHKRKPCELPELKDAWELKEDLVQQEPDKNKTKEYITKKIAFLNCPSAGFYHRISVINDYFSNMPVKPEKYQIFWTYAQYPNGFSADEMEAYEAKFEEYFRISGNLTEIKNINVYPDFIQGLLKKIHEKDFYITIDNEKYYIATMLDDRYPSRIIEGAEKEFHSQWYYTTDEVFKLEPNIIFTDALYPYGIRPNVLSPNKGHTLKDLNIKYGLDCERQDIFRLFPKDELLSHADEVTNGKGIRERTCLSIRPYPEYGDKNKDRLDKILRMFFEIVPTDEPIFLNTLDEYIRKKIKEHYNDVFTLDDENFGRIGWTYNSRYNKKSSDSFIMEVILRSKCKKIISYGTVFMFTTLPLPPIERLTLLPRQIEEIYSCRINPINGEDVSLECTHNSGFYSCMTETVKAIVHCFENGLVLRRIEFIESHRSFKDDPEMDLYPVMFSMNSEKIDSIQIPSEFTGKIDYVNGAVLRDINYKVYNQILEAYFLPSKRVTEKMSQIQNRANIDFEKTIGIVYRGTDKYTECAVAEPSEYIKVAKTLLAENPSLKVLIQTDQKQVSEMFKEEFGEKCISFNELPMTDTKTVIHNLISQNRLDFAISLDAVCRLAAKSKYLILGASNITCFIALYRKNAKGIYQFDDKGNLIEPY